METPRTEPSRWCKGHYTGVRSGRNRPPQGKPALKVSPQGLLDDLISGSYDPITECWEEQKAQEERKGETAATSSSSGSAAPSLYAAGIPRVQPLSSVEVQLETALDLCDKIQGALSRQPEPPGRRERGPSRYD